MPLNVLKKLSNNYIKACLFAYNCDFENFILYFGFDFLPSDEILTKYIVRGVLFSFDFAKSIKNCKNVEFNTYICRSVSARYIMSNVVDDIKFLKNNIPTTIWYPNAPSKDTCLKLLNIYPMYHYLVATVAILMNWEDVFIKCKFDGVDYTILSASKISNDRFFKYLVDLNKKEMICFYNLDDFLVRRKCFDYDISFSNEYDHSISFREVFGMYKTYGQCSEDNIKDMIGLTFEYNIEFDRTFMGFIKCISLGYNLILNENKKSLISQINNLNIHNVKFDILKSIYVLNNADIFNHDMCKSAVLNYILNDYYNFDLISKYKPFWFYSYKIISDKFADKILEDFDDLKYNVGLALCIKNTRYIYKKYEFKPDIDMLIYSYNSGSRELYNLILEDFKKSAHIYKHLDIDNEINLHQPKIIHIQDLNSYLNVKEVINFNNINEYIEKENPLLLRSKPSHFP